MGIFFDGMLSGKNIVKSNCSRNDVKKSGIQKFLDSNEEFSADISDGVDNINTNMCMESGVLFQDIPGMVKLVYSGLLAKSGAQQIYAALGYGNNDNWEEVEYIPMQKTARQTFEMLTFRKKPGRVNAAFKDDAGNWDNNSGANYSFYYAKEQGTGMQ